MVGLSRSALHEAGHAVIAHVVGLAVDEIRILDGSGRTHHSRQLREAPDDDLRALQAHVIVALAGPLSLLVAGDEDPWAGARGDLRSVDRIIEVLPPGSEERLLAAGRTLVRRHLAGIQAVAAEVMRAGGVLAGVDLAHVLETAAAMADPAELMLARRGLFERWRYDYVGKVTVERQALAWQLAGEAAERGEEPPSPPGNDEPIRSVWLEQSRARSVNRRPSASTAYTLEEAAS